MKDACFEVTLLKDADLTAFDKAVRDFASSLNGADTGLFYYAGHGVAVDTVVGRLEASGVRTVLIFLDSCRDNPFLTRISYRFFENYKDELFCLKIVNKTAFISGR